MLNENICKCCTFKSTALCVQEPGFDSQLRYNRRKTGGFMFPRLLALLALFSLSQISRAQQSATTKPPVPQSCAVTKPFDHPFVPPRAYRAQVLGSGVSWFGTDRFWTLLPSDAIWSLGEKTFWFRQEWANYKGRDKWIPGKDASKLTVTAQRLDGPAPPPRILRAFSSYREQDWKAFLVGGINFPAPGCWKVSGHYEDDELTFVIWVVK